MGTQNSKSSSSIGNLNSQEVQQIKSIFGTINNKKDSDPLVCPSNVFREYCEQKGLDSYLSTRCTSIISCESNSKHVAGPCVGLNDFLLFISTVLKGDLDEKVTIICRICTNSKTGENECIKEEDILKYASSLIDSYLNCVKCLAPMKSWAGAIAMRSTTEDESKNQLLASYMLRDLFYPDNSSAKSTLSRILQKKSKNLNSPDSFTLDALISGISKSVLFQNLNNFVWNCIFDFNRPKSQDGLIPHCYKVSSALNPAAFSILDSNSLLFLNSQLPNELRDEWRLLFSTTTHGESYASMYKRIKDKGSTVIILKSGDGWVFGGFATNSWAFSPKFYGDSRSFLFHLFPIFETYPATGYNTNFQYFNIDQKTLPNGLGMGGTLEYFGLWIDSEFGIGKCSPSCTTYSCPQLDKDQEFKIEHLEVWGVGPEPEKEEGVRDSKSILDQDPEAKAVLEIMGRNVTASEGYRDNQTEDE